MLSTTVTNASYSGAINNAGSFDAEPVISITVTTVTGGISQSMSLKNELTGQSLMITRTWAAGDTVSIDVGAKTVTINGAMADFSGQFPVFEPGVGSFGYIDTFTTRSVALSVVYKKRFA